MKKKILLLGSTGSIGTSALDVIASFPDLFILSGLAAHSNEHLLLSQAEKFKVGHLALSGGKPESSSIRHSGTSGLLHLIEESDADIVVNGIAGAPGFLPSVRSLETGKHLALANKETLVMAGDFITALAQKNERKILPVDSEHSAVFQLFHGVGADKIENIILTASGGAFRDLPKEKFGSVTLDDALRHPTWSMGKKITIDSASLANKGLEVIEAHHLFSLSPNHIQVLVHPQSYVHSLVETKEGTLYAQIGKPDMRIPILNALSYPDILPYAPGKFSLSGMSLSFSAVDREKFPMLELAYSALRRGGAAPLVYNAANEIAVEAFIAGRIPFPGIWDVVQRTLESRDWPSSIVSSEAVIETDKHARESSRNFLLYPSGDAK